MDPSTSSSSGSSSMPVNIGQLFARNWAIKLAAIFFAVMLYVAVAAQQPLSQRFALRLIVTVPPGRSVRQQPAGVTVTLSGKGSEILKLRSFPRMIRKTIPDTFSGSVWGIHLQPSDVSIPKGTDVQVAEIAPRDLDVLLDSVGKKDVRIVPLVRVEAESGYVLRGLAIVPGPFFRTVPLDTTPLGVVRVSPKEVRVAGEVAAIIERSIPAVPVTTAASGFAGFLLSPERVTVTMRGPESKVNTLTKDSVRVVAHLVGKAGPGGYARLTVTAPPGIRARAVPDSVALKRKTGRG